MTGVVRVQQNWLSRTLIGDLGTRIGAVEARLAAQTAALDTAAARIDALEAERETVATQLLDLAGGIERQRLTLVGYDKRLHWHADELRKLGTALIERIEFGRTSA